MTEQFPGNNPERTSRFARIAEAIANVTRYWCIPGYMPGYIPSLYTILPSSEVTPHHQIEDSGPQLARIKFDVTNRYVDQQIAQMEEQFR